MKTTKETAATPIAQTLVIERVFDAPQQVVFDMWTIAGHLEKWWGPKGFELSVSKLDLEPGGTFLYSMSGNGFEMWGKFVYVEVSPPGKLVFINSFTDKEGNIIRAPFSPTWPLEVINTLTLTESHGKTTAVLAGGPHNATDEEYQTFIAGIGSMQEGFGGTFSQLDEYLKEIHN